MTTDSLIIKIYDKIKVYYNEEENEIKSELTSNNGYLEINLDESTCDIYLVLYVMTNSAEKSTLLNIKLSEFNFSNFVSLNRIAFKTNKLFDLTSFYSIEFANSNDYFDLKNTLFSLKEIYIDIPNDRIEPLGEPDFFIHDTNIETGDLFPKTNATAMDEDYLISSSQEEIDFMCNKLQEAIANGDIDNSMKYASQLAKSKANLYISVSKIYHDTQKDAENKLDIKTNTKSVNQEVTNNNISELCTVFLTFKNDNERKCILKMKPSSTILELKEKIFFDFNIPIEYQFLVVNDCSTNDDDLLEIYTNKSYASTKIQSQELNAHLFVFSKNQNEWNCTRCTFINTPDVTACKMCQNEKEEELMDCGTTRESVEFKIYTEQLQEKMKKRLQDKFNELVILDLMELNENTEPFDCDICLEKNIAPHDGVLLKECLHLFCKACLINHINYSEDPVVKCPYSNEYNCMNNIQEREIRALLSPDEFKKFQLKSLRQSEASMKNTFHCKTPDCIGFCIHEDDLNFFECQVCEKVNCLRCNIIHMSKTCKEYQDDLKMNAENDENSRKNIEALEQLIRDNKAMHCPTCRIIVCKNEGCDWLICPMCKTEICWATKGPRWGPKGTGDTSGGCKCNLARGKPCTPKCGNCH